MSEVYYTGKLPIPWDMEVYQGEDFSTTLTYKDDNDAPVDLDGYESQMQVREEDTHAVLLDLNTTDGGITITAAAGEIGISITAAQTALLEVQNAEYDLLIKSATGTITYLIHGRFIVTPRVTRESIPAVP